MSTRREWSLLIIAATLGVLLVVVAVAVAVGVPVREITKDAAIGAFGALVGALTLHVGKQ